jgi:hypothetical protein
MLSIGMGVRQSFGLVLQPLTRDIAITVSDFTLAMAIQNLGWGFAAALCRRSGGAMGLSADHARRRGLLHRGPVGAGERERPL